ncbi:MAG: hypothetical protein JNM84_28435 [Planctomycetes bacterium]|nr:hypothetical protein [Planctomycetota bacterium]
MLIAITLLLALQDPEPAPAPKAPAAAADAEQRTVAVEAATRALSKLAPRRARISAQEWRAAEERMSAAVMAFAEQPEGLAWEHYARTIQATWRTQCYGACALLCEFALEHNEPTPELHCQLGMAKFSLVQMHLVPFDQRALARDAAAAFLAARELGRDQAPEPAILFRGQALAVALDFAAAIADLDALLAHPEHGAKVQRPHTQRARLLLIGDRAADAVAALEAAHEAGEATEGAFFLVRALAFADRLEDAVARARAAWREEASAEHLELLVDTLGAAGVFDEALELLERHPVVREEDETEEDLAERRRSRAALAYLVGLRGQQPADFLLRLRDALEHEVKIGSVDELSVQDLDTKKEPRSLSDAPAAIASWMLRQPSTCFGWANDALYLACIRALPASKERSLEGSLLEEFLPEEHWREIHRADAAAVARAMLAAHRMLPVASGILTASKLLAR